MYELLKVSCDETTTYRREMQKRLADYDSNQ